MKDVLAAAEQLNIKVTSLPWDAARPLLNDKGHCPILLVHPTLPPLVLIDVFSWEGETRFFCIAKNASAIVFTQEEFRNTPWTHALWRQTQVPTKSEVVVGDSRVSVDRKWHSFGGTTPWTVPSTEFRLSNTSDKPVRIERISTSCGCVIIAKLPTNTILPGATITLPVSLETASQEVIAQQIWVEFSSALQPGESPVSLPLAVYGWQPKSMELAPTRVSFGTVNRSQTAESVIRLTESQVDRFKLESVNFGGAPITEHLEKSERDGLSNYLIRLRLDPSDLNSGEHLTTARIKTTSRFRPVVEIPVNFVVASDVKARPAVVQFSVPNSAPVPVTLLHKDELPLNILVLEKPDGMNVQIEKQGPAAVLTLQR